MIEKTGRTLLFILFVLMIVAGANMTLRIAKPTIKKFSPSLADALNC